MEIRRNISTAKLRKQPRKQNKRFRAWLHENYLTLQMLAISQADIKGRNSCNIAASILLALKLYEQAKACKNF